MHFGIRAGDRFQTPQCEVAKAASGSDEAVLGKAELRTGTAAMTLVPSLPSPSAHEIAR